MSRYKQAVGFIILSALSFALMSFFVRLSGDLPTFQKAFFRNFVAMMVALPVFLRGRYWERVHFTKESALVLLCRICFGSLGVVGNFFAVDHMNLADATMLNKLSPFFSILASIVILKEYPKKTDWAILGVVFCGALLVMKPSFNVEFAYALVGFIGGLGAGTAYACVRRLGKLGIPTPVIVLAFSAASCVMMLPWAVFWGEPASLRQIGLLLLAGCGAAGGQFSITAAYQRAPARSISVFEYIQIIFAALLGLLFLGEKPDILSVIGYLVIISGAAVKHRRNR